MIYDRVYCNNSLLHIAWFRSLYVGYIGSIDIFKFIWNKYAGKNYFLLRKYFKTVVFKTLKPWRTCANGPFSANELKKQNRETYNSTLKRHSNYVHAVIKYMERRKLPEHRCCYISSHLVVICTILLKFKYSQLTFTFSKSAAEPLEIDLKRCLKLTIKTPERRHWRRSGVFIVNFKHLFTPISSGSTADFEKVDVSSVVYFCF